MLLIQLEATTPAMHLNRFSEWLQLVYWYQSTLNGVSIPEWYVRKRIESCVRMYDPAIESRFVTENGKKNQILILFPSWPASQRKEILDREM